MPSVIAGQLTKLISIAAKAMLLLAVIPFMKSGEYSTYFTATTVALLIGRLGGFAAEEQIVLFVRTSKVRWAYFIRTGLGFHLLTGLGIVAAVLSGADEIFLFCATLALGFITANYITGVLRISFSLAIEISGGLPWVIATAIAVITRPEFAIELLKIICLCYFISNSILLVVVLRKLKDPFIRPGFQGLFYLGRMHRHWRTKLASNMLLAVNLRTIPLGCELLGKSSVLLDAVALAFSIGEVCYQLVMVRVNRSFTARVLQRSLFSIADLFRELKFTTMMIVGCSVGLYAFGIAGILPKVFGADVWLNIFAAAYCGATTLFCFYRMHVWSAMRKNSVGRPLCFQLILLVEAFAFTALIDNLYVSMILSILTAVGLYFIFSFIYINSLKKLEAQLGFQAS